MKKDDNRLGKGLGAIFGDDLSDVIEEIQQGEDHRASEIDLSEIRPNPYQPRKIFDDEKIGELAQSIKEHGVFTPVLLRKSLTGYELIAGERRVRASKLAGRKSIPAIVMEFTEEQMMEISLLENIQREDLNAIEEAQAYQRLIERLDYTQEKLAHRVGKSREHITNTMRLLRLPQSVQQLVVENKLSMGHVRPLVTIEDEGEAYDLAMKIAEEGLSVREVERLVKERNEKPKPKPEKKKEDPNLVYVEEIMQNKLQTKVKVDKKQIVIHYTGTKDLNRILELLNCIEESNGD